ncbi:MAG: putative flippase GtrA [Bacillariaceae sp.]|jgi:putative flippase GtrA
MMSPDEQEFLPMIGSEATTTTTTTVISKTIAWIENRKAPACILRRLRLHVQESESSFDDDDDDNALYIITGVGKVWYGTRPAAEVVKIFGFIPPRYICFMVSGCVCDVVQFIIYATFYWLIINDPSLCWMTSFFGSIVFRHTSHRYLVFGNYIGSYWNSLIKMYLGYSIIIIISTIFNIIMTKYVKVPHLIAWFITLLWTGVVNYFILKKIWSWDGTSSTTSTTSKGVSSTISSIPATVDDNSEQIIELKSSMKNNTTTSTTSSRSSSSRAYSRPSPV